MRALATLLALLMPLLLALPASAQIGNPAGMAPGTPQSPPGIPAPHQPNTQDRLFAQLATLGGMAEVGLGRLAQEKGENSAVKEFAQNMVQDHSKAGDELPKLAKEAVIALPDELDPDHQEARAELEKLSASQFDLAYMRGQIVEHQKAIQLFEWEINGGQDGDIQRFASKTLPTIFAHLQMAQDILTQMTSQAPQGAAPQAILKPHQQGIR